MAERKKRSLGQEEDFLKCRENIVKTDTWVREDLRSSKRRGKDETTEEAEHKERNQEEKEK